MADKKHGRRAADTRVKTPLTELTEALNAHSGAMGKRAAVVAAAGGLLVTATLPATAHEKQNTTTSTDTAADTTESVAPEFVAQAATKSADAKLADVAAGVAANVSATKAPKPEVTADSEGATATSGGTGSAESGSSSSKSGAATGDVSIPDGTKAQQVIALAKQFVGTPYVSGGTSPSGWDCSGFTSYVFSKVGVSLPRTSSAQSHAGQVVSRSQAQPGDLIWSPGHVGIYAGNGMMYDAGNPRVDTTYRSIDWMVASGAKFIRVL